MKTSVVFTRRHFIKGSLGASFVLGLQMTSCQSTSWPSSASATTFRADVYLSLAADNSMTMTIPRSEMGQGVRTSLAMIVAEELDADWSTVRVEQAPAGEEYGDQFTGGSTSINTFWQPLRETGAVARAMLLAAAAQAWGVEAGACVTEKSTVIHPASGRRLTYGELAETAAQMPIPDPANLTLKDPQDFHLVGTPMGQLDGPHMVEGSAIYGLDVKVPGMLYATLARCPVFGGKLVSFDATQSKAVEGVRDVVEIENAVAVVAENTWAAIQGREALSVTWDEGQNVTVSSESIRQSVLAQLPASVTSAEIEPIQAKGKLEALYEMPYLAHAPMEPMNCVADVHWNHCEVWAPTQNPKGAKDIVRLPLGGRVIRRLQSLTGLPENAIKVNVTLMGGGFDRRLAVDYVSEAVQVSQAMGAPVQVVWTREDDIQYDRFHPLSYHYLSVDLDPLAEITRQTYEGPSDFPTGAWRSVENFTQAFVEECFLDELAAALDKDPYELRLKWIKNPQLKAVLELAATKAGWGNPLPAGWGRGLAAYSTWGKLHCAVVVEVSVDENNQVRVRRVLCAVDCGLVINPDMVKAQLEGGVVFALPAALKSKITLAKGRVQQSNFHDYPVWQLDEMPLVETYIMPSSEPPRGVGEASGPPLTPAVANAIFAATGKRIRHIPIRPEDLQKV